MQQDRRGDGARSRAGHELPPRRASPDMTSWFHAP